MNVDENVAYMNGFGTGYSSGYAGSMSWFKGAMGSCGIGIGSIPHRPKNVESAIYALDFWIYEYLYNSGRLMNISSERLCSFKHAPQISIHPIESR